MNLKKLLCLFVIAMLVFSLSGCGGSSSSNVSGNSGDNTTQQETNNNTNNNTDNNTETETNTGTTYSTTSAGNAIARTDGGTYTFNNITVTKTGDPSSSSENYDFTGGNAAILASGGSKVTITGSSTKITTNAKYGNGVFSYGGNSSNSSSLNSSSTGDGTTVTISDATIETSSSNSGGIMTTGGGIMNATNLTITTSGGSSAAIRSDRGGGTVTVNQGTYTTSGTGSPAIYSTAAITVTDADLTANNSQGVVIEGGNSVTLNTCNVNANHATLNGQDSTRQAILIYQSMSGDASNGTSAFSMTGGNITNTVGDIFCITNTACTIDLSGVSITNKDSSGNFLRAAHQNWGSNGGTVTLNASSQTISGNILVDSSSSLTMNLKSSSTYSGAINNSGTSGTVNVTIENGSTWTLTGNSYVSSLTNNGTINKGNYTLYVNGTAQ